MNRILVAALICSPPLMSLPPQTAVGQNVDLVTLPRRDTVQLTIYNSEDITLAKETRFVTLKQGMNRLQFSWAGTLIDPTSVTIRPLAQQDDITVVDTIYPGQKPQHLIWSIQSDIEGQVPMEVMYFTSGLTWQMDYVAIADAQERRLDFDGYVRVYNNSGEEYDDAEIRLIVGKINLVEKIEALARQQGLQPPALATAKYRDLKRDAYMDSVRRSGGFGGGGGAMAKPKEIVKEGVSEYFMFSVEGQESIRHGWSKRMRAVTARDVAFKTVYRMRAFQYGPRPVRFFTWNNRPEDHLGETPLPDGLVRVFRQNDAEGLGYLGQQKLNYVPIQAKIEVNLGPDDLVVYERRQTGTRRFNFSFHANQRVDGWDQSQDWTDTIRNYRLQPIQFELQLQLPGDVEFESESKTASFDYRTVESSFPIPSLGSREYLYGVTTHLGTNAKQDRVRLK